MQNLPNAGRVESTRSGFYIKRVLDLVKKTKKQRSLNGSYFTMKWTLWLLVSFFQSAMGSYLYRDDPESASAVTEYTDSQGLFEQSTHPRVVEFYSPFCVSTFHHHSTVSSVFVVIQHFFAGRLQGFQTQICRNGSHTALGVPASGVLRRFL